MQHSVAIKGRLACAADAAVVLPDGDARGPGRLCYLKADRAKRTLHVLNLLPQLADPEDILLVNLGIHYNEMDDLADDMTMVGFALGKYELPRHRIWVETPPQHYETPTGEGRPLLLWSFPAKP